MNYIFHSEKNISTSFSPFVVLNKLNKIQQVESWNINLHTNDFIIYTLLSVHYNYFYQIYYACIIYFTIFGHQ